MIHHLPSGEHSASVGLLSFAFAKTRSVRNSLGGSGKPITCEVVHGIRLSRPNGFSGVTARAVKEPQTATMSATSNEQRTMRRIMGQIEAKSIEDREEVEWCSSCYT